MEKLKQQLDLVCHRRTKQILGFPSTLRTGSHKSHSACLRLASAIVLHLLGSVTASSLFAQDLHVEGRMTAEALKRGDFPGAIVICSNLINRNPESASARYDRGVVYLMEGEFASAIADLVRASDMDPTKPAHYSTLAIAYAARGSTLKSTADCDKALAMSDKALQRDPRFVDAYGARGWSYVCKAEATRTFAPCDAAITAFTTLIKAHPQDGRAYIGRGRAYHDSGKYDQAIADENRAIQLSPRSVRAYNERGISYTNKGDQNRAIADFTKCIQFANPTVSARERAAPYYNRGYSLNIEEKYSSAITDFTRAISLYPAADYYSHRAVAYFHTRNYQAEIADLSHALQQNPTAWNHNSLAWFLATCPRGDLRDGKRAIQHATQACEMTKWKNGDFIDTLAAAYAETGEFEKAVEKETQALALPDMRTKHAEGRAHLLLYQSRTPFREEHRDPPKPVPLISGEPRRV